MPKKPTSYTYSFELDAKTAARFDALMAAREIDAGLYLRLHIRALVKQDTLLSLKDDMDFGKYAGEAVSDVVRVDPGYVFWTVKNCSKPKFGPDVLALLDKVHGDK